MNEILRISGLNKSFKTDFWKEPQKVLKDLSFSVAKGGLCGFLGPNGAGKTTTIKILLRFIRANSGEISFNPDMGKNWNQIRSNIGYFPERPYFYPHLTGMEFAFYIGKIQSLDRSSIIEQTHYWAERLSIKHALDRQIKDYSKGMLQRLGFTVSIIHNPKFLILDEPLSGLDPIGRRDFKRIMVDLAQKDTTVFFSSHIVSDVEEICNNVVVLMDGKTFYEGDIDKLIEKNHNGRYEFVINKAHAEKINTDQLDLVNLGNDLLSITVDDSLKNEVLANMMDKKIDLRSMRAVRPTLEEIVYTNRES